MDECAMRSLPILLLLSGLLHAQEWRPLLNGKNLDGWEIRGDGIWTVMKDGTLIGHRPHPHRNPSGAWPVPRKQESDWAGPRAWLYTAAESVNFCHRAAYRI